MSDESYRWVMLVLAGLQMFVLPVAVYIARGLQQLNGRMIKLEEWRILHHDIDAQFHDVVRRDIDDIKEDCRLHWRPRG